MKVKQEPTFIQFVAVGMDPVCSDHPNMTIVGDGKKALTKEQITQVRDGISKTKEPKVAIIYAHGSISNRGSERMTHVQGDFINADNESLRASDPTLNPSRSSYIRATIDNIDLVIDAVAPDHIDILSCFSGGVEHDIKRNLNAIAKKMQLQDKKELTICGLSSSKHQSWIFECNQYITDTVNNANPSEHIWLDRVGEASKIAETLAIQRIIIQDNGVPKLLAFKIKAPKTKYDIEHPETFIGSHVMYGDKVANKENRREAQIVTIEGREGDKDHDNMKKEIVDKLVENGKVFNAQYLQSSYINAVGRGKFELSELWLDQMSPDIRSTSIKKALSDHLCLGIQSKKRGAAVQFLANLKYMNDSRELIADLYDERIFKYAIETNLPEVLKQFFQSSTEQLSVLQISSQNHVDLNFVIEAGINPKEKQGDGYRWCDAALLSEAAKDNPDSAIIGVLLENGANPEVVKKTKVWNEITEQREIVITPLLNMVTPATKAFIETKLAEIALKKAAQEIGQGLQDLVGAAAAHVALPAKPKEAGIGSRR